MVGDQPPEAEAEQFRICTEELAALQQQQEQENELDRSLDLKWVTRNWEQIEVSYSKLQLAKKAHCSAQLLFSISTTRLFTVVLPADSP